MGRQRVHLSAAPPPFLLICFVIVDSKIKLAPELIKTLFDEMCSAMEMNETIIHP